MGAGTFQFTALGRKALLNGTLDLDTNAFNMALFQSTTDMVTSSRELYSLCSNEVANSFGYTTGGVSVTVGLTGTTTVNVTCTDGVWLASGGSIVARYAVVYATGSSQILGYVLLDSTPANVTSTSGNQLVVSIAGTGIYEFT